MRSRLVGRAPHPVLDSWQEDGFHFFVFLLNPADRDATQPPVAVFTMHPEMAEPVSAITVTPTGRGGQAEVRSLKDPDQAYSVPLV